MNDIAIKVENLSKVYKLYDKPIDRLKESLSITKKCYHREHYALKNVGFEVKKGEILGIIGKNGSGKSTLLKIITGVLTPTSGNIIVNGRVSALLELGAGFNLEYTGIENIYLNGTLMGYTRQEINEKIENIIDFADIGEFINQPVKTYSSGMFARLAFAVAINVEPDILIVDEVLAVGDIDFQLKCMAKFNEFKEKGKTILFVSHDINSIKKYCNRTIWIQNGTLEGQGNTDIITDKYLDYLKRTEENTTQQDNSNYLKTSDIAEIADICIINSKGQIVDTVNYGEKITVKLNFNMYKEIENVVVGIAIKSIDHKYICGLNTLLDKFNIKYRIGQNMIYLEYDNLNLIGGSYYFDAAIFESNAHVPIDYKVKIKDFFVITPYVGEGIVIMKHDWKLESSGK